MDSLKAPTTVHSLVSLTKHKPYFQCIQHTIVLTPTHALTLSHCIYNVSGFLLNTYKHTIVGFYSIFIFIIHVYAVRLQLISTISGRLMLRLHLKIYFRNRLFAGMGLNAFFSSSFRCCVYSCDGPFAQICRCPHVPCSKLKAHICRCPHVPCSKLNAHM